jgi:transketolase
MALGVKQNFPLSELPAIAQRVRANILRMVHAAGSGHVGGALGTADLLTYLYFRELDIAPEQASAEGRDRFVLSPAHQVPGLYSVLAARGYFPEEELLSFRKFGSRLKGHAFLNPEIGLETTGGSLGQGLSIACGLALSARLDGDNGESAFRTFCLISDGELNEGQTWEAIMFAAKEKLDKLRVFVDLNGIQLSGDTNEIMPLERVGDKFREFGWYVLEVDGHDFQQLAFALNKVSLVNGKPVAIICNNTPGKGVDFMENQWEWHGKAPNDEELNFALEKLQA